MPRIIRGTKDAKTGATILKGGSGGVTKITCPSCGGHAQLSDVNNSKGYSCTRCGNKFTAKKM